MKKALYIGLLPLALSACIHTIPVDFGEVEPRLVLNAQLSAADGEQAIYLSESALTTIKPQRGATVSVLVDGKPFAQAQEAAEPDEAYACAAAYHFQGGFPSGSQVTVKAVLGGTEVSAQSVVETAPRLVQVDTLRVTEQDFGDTYVSFQFKITLRDLPGNNYYRVGVRCDDLIYLIDADENRLEIPYAYELPVDGKQEPVLGGGVMGASIFDLDPTFLVFTDQLFQDQDYTLHLSLPVESLAPFYYIYDSQFKPVRSETLVRLIPWVESITEAEYHYLEALNNLENFGYEAQMVVEPTTLPSNVQGGLGFVSVLNRTESAPLVLPLVLQEFEDMDPQKDEPDAGE